MLSAFDILAIFPFDYLITPMPPFKRWPTMPHWPRKMRRAMAEKGASVPHPREDAAFEKDDDTFRKRRAGNNSIEAGKQADLIPLRRMAIRRYFTRVTPSRRPTRKPPASVFPHGIVAAPGARISYLPVISSIQFTLMSMLAVTAITGCRFFHESNDRKRYKLLKRICDSYFKALLPAPSCLRLR